MNDKEKKEKEQESDIEQNCGEVSEKEGAKIAKAKQRPKNAQKLMMRFWDLFRVKTVWWKLNHVFPFMGVYTKIRQNMHPDVFGFEMGPQSRINYRKRFSFALGNN